MFSQTDLDVAFASPNPQHFPQVRPLVRNPCRTATRATPARIIETRHYRYPRSWAIRGIFFSLRDRSTIYCRPCRAGLGLDSPVQTGNWTPAFAQRVGCSAAMYISAGQSAVLSTAAAQTTPDIPRYTSRILRRDAALLGVNPNGLEHLPGGEAPVFLHETDAAAATMRCTGLHCAFLSSLPSVPVHAACLGP